MKKHLQLSAILLAMGVFLSAQETTEVSVKVTKDGKVVKDTTYTFDDVKEAKNAVHMLEAMESDDLDLYFTDSNKHDIHMDKDGNIKKHAKHVVFISEDGQKVEKVDGSNMKVIVKEIEDGDFAGGKKKVMKKEIIVISDSEEGEDIEWTIIEDEDGENVEVIVIKKNKDSDEDINVELIMKEKQEKKMKEEKPMKKKVKKEK